MQGDTPHAVCGAKTRSGKPCCNRPMPNGRCRMHGGASLRGEASPAYKHGRHSRYMPERLQQIYNQALEDSELIGVRQEIALIDALLSDNLRNLDPTPGDNAQFWNDALEQIQWARQAYKSENYGGLERSLDELEALADRRRLHFAAEKEIREKVEQRRKLVETEQKIALQGERAITAEELMLFMGGVVDLIKRIVDDKQQRVDIFEGIDRLVASNAKSIH